MVAVMKRLFYVLLGAIVALGLFALVICIASSVNGVSFAQQIVDWFGPKAVEEVESIVQSIKAFKLVA